MLISDHVTLDNRTGKPCNCHVLSIDGCFAFLAVVAILYVVNVATASPASGIAKCPKQSAPETQKKISDQLRSSVAVIEGTYGHGSGFVVLPKVIATNSHVIRDDLMKDIKVTFVSASGERSQPMKVELLYEDKSNDLALLHVPLLDGRPVVKLNTSFEPSGKNKVYIIGNPGQGSGLSRVNTISESTAEEIVRLNKNFYVQLKVSNRLDLTNVGPGNSGGPVVDADGKLIGILTAAMTQKGKPIEKTFCIPSNVVQAAIERVNNNNDWKERILKATGSHALDIVIVHMYINAKIAKVVFDGRVELNQKGEELLAEYTNAADRQLIVKLVLQKDQEYIKVFKELDDQTQKMVRQPIQTLTSSDYLPSDQAKDLVGLRSNLDQIRKTIMSRQFSNADYQKCLKSISNFDAYFQRLKEKSGLSEDMLDEMLQLAVLATKDKLNSHKLR